VLLGSRPKTGWRTGGDGFELSTVGEGERGTGGTMSADMYYIESFHANTEST